MKRLCVVIVISAALGLVGSSASAAILTYDVNMNFNPGQTEGAQALAQ